MQAGIVSAIQQAAALVMGWQHLQRLQAYEGAELIGSARCCMTGSWQSPRR